MEATMDFSLTEEQIMFRDLFRDFAQKEVTKVAKHTDELAEPPVALIKKAAANRTVLMVEHNLSVVEHLSDGITVQQRGEILAEGDYKSVSANPDVIQAYLGAGHG